MTKRVAARHGRTLCGQRAAALGAVPPVGRDLLVRTHAGVPGGHRLPRIGAVFVGKLAIGASAPFALFRRPSTSRTISSRQTSCLIAGPSSWESVSRHLNRGESPTEPGARLVQLTVANKTTPSSRATICAEVDGGGSDDADGLSNLSSVTLCSLKTLMILASFCQNARVNRVVIHLYTILARASCDRINANFSGPSGVEARDFSSIAIDVSGASGRRRSLMALIFIRVLARGS